MLGDDRMPSAEERRVVDLTGLRFRVPDYQRGYRWSEQNVRDLLDDLYDFGRAPENVGKRYCLQPLVVQPEPDGDGGTFNVIDGQQRLTTVLVILGLAYRGDATGLPYELAYDTRPTSADFLRALPDLETDDDDFKDNADFYHLAQAGRAVRTWLEENQVSPAMFLRNVVATLEDSTFFIWYELHVDDDPIAMFRKLNIGKIPLTNAELIKALLLGTMDDRDRAVASQQWDQMEQRLGDPALWGFLSNDRVGEQLATRIDLVFRIWAEDEREHRDRDDYFPFRTVADRLAPSSTAATGSSKAAIANEIWSGVCDVFSHLVAWYQDPEIYHRAGFLLAVSGPDGASDLFARLKGRDRSDLRRLLQIRVGRWLDEALPKPEKDAEDPLRSRFEQLTFGSRDVGNVLLLLNIETVLQADRALRTSDAGRGREYHGAMRFPFDAYKNERWDIEHIHAVNSQPPRARDFAQSDNAPAKAESARKSYLTSLRDLLSLAPSSPAREGAIQRLDGFLAGDGYMNEEPVTVLMKSDEMTAAVGELIPDADALGNLTLLDQSTNRGYQDAWFAAKRDYIIRNTGARMIPPATRNVFLKYYSDGSSTSELWSAEDREAYVNGPMGIVRTLAPYLTWAEGAE